LLSPSHEHVARAPSIKLGLRSSVIYKNYRP